jgi:hypothetical protein
MKNLILVNFNSEKWKFITNRYLKTDHNIYVGYKNNISKLKKQKQLKLISLNYESLFFHKKINIGNNLLKRFFYLFFFKIIKILANIFIRMFNFDNYITSDDMTGTLNLILINLFKDNNKKIYLYLDNRANNEKYFIKERSKYNKYLVNDDKFITKYKNICRKIPNKKEYISFFEKNLVKILDNLKCLPRNPFRVNNLKYHKLIVRYIYEDSLLKDKLIFDSEKLKKKKDLIFTKYNLINKKKLIIVGLTNWYEHSMTNLQDDYTRNEDMVKIITHNYKNCNLLISLHPKQKTKDYLWLSKKYRIKIIKESLIDVMPISSLFVTSFGSSVLQWAKICKIKSVVFNFYKDKNINIKNSKILTNITSKKNIKKKLIYI